MDSWATDAYVTSWLELVLLLHNHELDPSPVCVVSGKWVAATSPVFPPPAHTVAVRMSLLSRVVRPALCSLEPETLLNQGTNRSDLGFRPVHVSIGFLLLTCFGLALV